jgi:cell division protein FtsL
MNLRLAEKQDIYRKENQPLLYLVKTEDEDGVKENVVYTNSALFYILVMVIVFACLGILLNIGLKIQSINYQKEIYQLNEMISLESERNDRLQLKIAELKSPSRVIEIAQNNIGMEITDNSRIIEISNAGLENNENIYSYISRNTNDNANEGYKGFLGTIYYIQDIVNVVSESVLTFFIP